MSLIRINRNPSRRQLLVFAAAWLVFFGIGAATLFHRGRTNPAIFLGTLAAAVPLAGLAVPGILRFAYLGLSYATYPIGFVVSHAVLALLYYVVLTPIGWVMKLGGYDPLRRRLEPSARSYWQERDTKKTAASYFRQS